MSRETAQVKSARDSERTDVEPSPPYWAASLAGLLVFGLYALTLSRTTAFWDTSEYIATGHILGIPHQPGNPLFVVLSRAWSVLLAPLGVPVAIRFNLFSALMSAGAHAMWFLVVHHILCFFSEDRRFRLVGASAAVLVSATAFTVWNQSNVNEKVYTVSLLTIAVLSWLAFRWQERLAKGKDDNLLVLMAFLLALSVGNHLMAFLAAPAIGLFILFVRPQTLLNWRLYAAGIAAVMLGLSIHLFLPIRAALDPVINEAAPTCENIGSALLAVVTYGRDGCELLAEALNRSQYEKPGLLPRLAPLWSQAVNYLQYFDWQWARSLDGNSTVFATLRLPFTMLFTGLGVWGAIEHARRDRASFVFMGTLFATLSFGLLFYMNFKYGFSLQAPVQDRLLHEVRERDYFFTVGFSVWGLWAGIGIATLWREAAREMGVGLTKASPILGLALIPLVLNFSWASRADDYAARDWAHNLLMSVEPYGVLFTNGDNDTFPLWYLQEVEGIRRDVTVIVTSYLNTDWYTGQLKRLTQPCPPGVDPSSDWTRIQCQRPYTSENTDAAYVADASQASGKIPLLLDAPIRVPTKSIMPLSDEDIGRVARSVQPVTEDSQVQMGNVIASLPGGSYLMPWQQFALTLIISAIGERPIYFASSGNAATSLGVNRYLVRQGLAFRLHNGPLEEQAPDGVMQMNPTAYSNIIGGWVDLPRTHTLLEQVFVHRTGLPDEWTHWPDLATIGIPNYYAWSYLALAQAAVQNADDEALQKYQERAEAWTLLGT
ncbi:MAG TPA: DUF2723 domain-containing protein [Gemmatimonadetes bacterium]|nr:DUF2723 domain-containing protein [Gemmatimonadota bacterium]